MAIRIICVAQLIAGQQIDDCRPHPTHGEQDKEGNSYANANHSRLYNITSYALRMWQNAAHAL